MVMVVRGERYWLWRAVDDEREVLDFLVQKRRDAMRNGGKMLLKSANTELNQDFCRDKDAFKPGAYVMIAASDTGTRMSSDVQEKAFDPFFTTKEVGTGMGLSMIYGFVKQSNGHVSLHSELGSGTTMKLYFPKSQGKSLPMARERLDEVPISGSNESILLVEDDPLIQNQLIMQLNVWVIR